MVLQLKKPSPYIANSTCLVPYGMYHAFDMSNETGLNIYIVIRDSVFLKIQCGSRRCSCHRVELSLYRPEQALRTPRAWDFKNFYTIGTWRW